ncbi:MAG: hypothetical protein P0Y66_22285 [Candidatus Kaistia colombiensis]|nr:MAG: hypothetical protein P0Y66_22285 [Kaistia sp.]
MNPYKTRAAGSLHDALARGMSQIATSVGMHETAGPQVAADFEGISKYTIYKALDPDQRDDIGFGRVARLTSKFGMTAPAEFLATLAGGVFLPVSQDHEGAWAELSADVADHIGQLLAEIFRDLSPASDGGTEITPPEADRILRDLEVVTRAVATMTSLARKASGRAW